MAVGRKDQPVRASRRLSQDGSGICSVSPPQVSPRYPLANLAWAGIDTLLEFFAVATGDGIEPQEWVFNREFEHTIPQQMSGYTHAYQQRGDLWFLPLNLLHVPVRTSVRYSPSGYLLRRVCANATGTTAIAARLRADCSAWATPSSVRRLLRSAFALPVADDVAARHSWLLLQVSSRTSLTLRRRVESVT